MRFNFRRVVDRVLARHGLLRRPPRRTKPIAQPRAEVTTSTLTGPDGALASPIVQSALLAHATKETT